MLAIFFPFYGIGRVCEGERKKDREIREKSEGRKTNVKKGEKEKGRKGRENEKENEKKEMRGK